jgi:nucleoside-diphosphate-sugar epimerase
MSDSTKSTVLVTGASGFIAMHCVLQLLEQGYQVRGTLRSLDREAHIRKILSQHTEVGDLLEFVRADLLEDEGWQAATEGCKFVLHVASPFPFGLPKHEDELILPAKEGTLRVLKAAAASDVKRVVLTSSVVAIMEGHGKTDKTFDENDWSNLDGDIEPYPKSKTIAEQAAWQFIEQQESTSPMELSVINPGFVMGPLLDGQHFGTSAETIRKVLAGEYPGFARIMFSIVDVRDVAAAHLAAMINPIAAGKRYLCTVDAMWFKELCDILHRRYADQGYKIPTRQLPDIAVRIFAFFDPSTRSVLNSLGQEIRFSNQQIKKDLDWKPYSAEEAVVAMAQSLIQHGVV